MMLPVLFMKYRMKFYVRARQTPLTGCSHNDTHCYLLSICIRETKGQTDKTALGAYRFGFVQQTRRDWKTEKTK